MKIGVFDSGLGGLTILKSLLEQLPEYDYVYLGDNARVPYGNRSPEVIYEFTKQAVDFLFKQDCKIVILACNTATATSLRKIQQEYLLKHFPDRKVLGVIRPTVETVLESGTKKIGVIGTRATVISASFVKEIMKMNSELQVFQQACPLLVPIIEEAEIEWEGIELILMKYIKELQKNNIDSLILGCTHYGLVEKQIQKAVGNNVHIFSEGTIVAKKLKSYFNNHPEVESCLSKNNQRIYYVTDVNERFKKMMKLFLGNQINDEDRLQLVRI
ncbi:MAG: glutamate racemase [bacterium]|nr:glutamate racemase [bacterium]